MERKIDGENKDWAELREKLMALLDEVHKQREQEEERQKSRHFMKVKISIRTFGKKEKRKIKKSIIKI